MNCHVKTQNGHVRPAVVVNEYEDGFVDAFVFYDPDVDGHSAGYVRHVEPYVEGEPKTEEHAAESEPEDGAR